MAMTFTSRTLSVSINCHLDKVYEFVSNPENFPIGAVPFFKSVTRSNADWIVDTPEGPIKVGFFERNEFGC
jgi:hypothetical protein